MERRDWARATGTTVTVYAPTSPNHPQLDEELYQDAALNVRRWVVALDYGDGSLLVEGDAHELLLTLRQAVNAMRTSQGMDSEYSDGYRAARSFYGDDAREALRSIAAEIAGFRAEFPAFPHPVERWIARIERHAAATDPG